jgi:hypothetical protein
MERFRTSLPTSTQALVNEQTNGTRLLLLIATVVQISGAPSFCQSLHTRRALMRSFLVPVRNSSSRMSRINSGGKLSMAAAAVLDLIFGAMVPRRASSALRSLNEDR